MKPCEELFLAIGGLESARLAKTEETPRSVKRPKPRLVLIAAVIALAALLVGCAVAVYARIHTNVKQYDVPTATVSPDGSVEAKNVLTDCYPQALPDGYRMVGGSPIDRTTQSIEFANDAGQTITYIISTAERDDITLASAESSEVAVSGQSGTMQVSDEGQTIAWHNETEGYYAWLDTEDMAVDLQAMADSVAFGQPLPLSFLCKDGAIWAPHYPQQLPDGYTIDRVSFASDVVIIDYSSEGEAITYVVSPTYDLRDTVSDPPHDSFVWTDETVGEDAARMLTTSGGLRILLWENTREGFYAYLSTMDENVDILAMAPPESPSAKPRITWDRIIPLTFPRIREPTMAGSPFTPSPRRRAIALPSSATEPTASRKSATKTPPEISCTTPSITVLAPMAAALTERASRKRWILTEIRGILTATPCSGRTKQRATPIPSPPMTILTWLPSPEAWASARS